MALAGLVADYSDSSSDEETDALVSKRTDHTSTDFFHTTNAESGDSSDNDSHVTTARDAVLEQKEAALPNPLADSSSRLISPALSALSSSRGTVFGNRFADQEKAELAIFEKHVKMTEDCTNTRPPCFKFKRGACRKGNGCRFSHDLGFQPPNRITEDHPETSADAPVEVNSVVDWHQSTSTKKRVGVTNTLMPAKKAKKNLDGQRAKDRPWTVNH